MKLPYAYVAFEGEQHGWRKDSTIKRAMDGELYFLSQVFGFKAAGDIEPLEIENFTPQTRERATKTVNESSGGQAAEA